jgi:hypothetical protein
MRIKPGLENEAGLNVFQSRYFGVIITTYKRNSVTRNTLIKSLLTGEDTMTQRVAIILSAILTAFLLVVGGGVVARISSNPQPAEAAPVATLVPASVPTGTPAPDINAQVEALIQERETQYRALIQQANDRLQAAYDQQAAAQAAASQAAPRTTTAAARPAAPAAQPAAAPAVAVSADAAAGIATAVAGGNKTIVRAPELVLFGGVIAYEVVFKHGSIYVDANSGQVLFNGTVHNGNQTASAPPASNGDHESDHGDD